MAGDRKKHLWVGRHRKLRVSCVKVFAVRSCSVRRCPLLPGIDWCWRETTVITRRRAATKKTIFPIAVTFEKLMELTERKLYSRFGVTVSGNAPFPDAGINCRWLEVSRSDGWSYGEFWVAIYVQPWLITFRIMSGLRQLHLRVVDSASKQRQRQHLLLACSSLLGNTRFHSIN